MKKNDVILLAVLITLFLALVLILFLFIGRSESDTVVIEVDGKVIEELPIHKDTEYLIGGINGGSNLLIIKDGKAYVSEASCPDKVCVNTGALSELKPIVCLPNKVIITLKEGK